MTTADRTIHAIDSVLDAHEAAYHPGIACPETQEGRCALARPVESPEDRMRDARTDTTDRSFAAYLTAQERDQLDARAATAEQERDDALDAYKEARDVAQQLAAFRQGVIDRHRQELGAAGDVLAVVRDAAERIDRALAAYDTQPAPTAEALPGAVPVTQDEIRDLLAGRAEAAERERDKARAELVAAQELIAAAKTWRRWHGNTNAAYADACQALEAAVDALGEPQSPGLGSPAARAQDEPREVFWLYAEPVYAPFDELTRARLNSALDAALAARAPAEKAEG